MNEETEVKFNEYVEKYCRTYNLTPEEAKRHRLVQEVKKSYEEEEGDLICEL